ncbi:hypothetical protein [Nakamurella flava]|uniref:hypothetical protein n=1 Tax=Nakamurella flava TaxID=2576308 RepID=UPI00140E2022|nr:hypothetical protein [Nakamurella flava]
MELTVRAQIVRVGVAVVFAAVICVLVIGLATAEIHHVLHGHSATLLHVVDVADHLSAAVGS